MNNSILLRVGAGCTRPDIEEGTLFLTVPDVHGTYTLPYIQSDPTLDVTTSPDSVGATRVQLSLQRGGAEIRSATATRSEPTVRFQNLPPGEYVLEAVALDANHREVARTLLRHIGIGTVIAALGDSITEGYFGVGFYRGEHLDFSLFPPSSVSRDRRNFPQYAPTAHYHLPSVNCFQSWMTCLNDLLAQSWNHPVFIANEGWGGHTTSDTLRMITTDACWQERMRILQPNLWLVHLGVNDERSRIPAAEVESNLRKIVETILQHHAVAPENIFVAKPSYDYASGAAEQLRSYCARIDHVVQDLGLSPGPDFYRAFSKQRKRWYGTDPVHPNVEGMRRMAFLWHQSIIQRLPPKGKSLSPSNRLPQRALHTP